MKFIAHLGVSSTQSSILGHVVQDKQGQHAQLWVW